MRVQVRRVSAMPHNVQIWVDDEPGRFLMLIDRKVITAEGSRLLENLLNYTVQHWARKDEPQRLTLHTHAG